MSVHKYCTNSDTQELPVTTQTFRLVAEQLHTAARRFKGWLYVQTILRSYILECFSIESHLSFRAIPPPELPTFHKIAHLFDALASDILQNDFQTLTEVLRALFVVHTQVQE